MATNKTLKSYVLFLVAVFTFAGLLCSNSSLTSQAERPSMLPPTYILRTVCADSLHGLWAAPITIMGCPAWLLSTTRLLVSLITQWIWSALADVDVAVDWVVV